MEDGAASVAERSRTRDTASATGTGAQPQGTKE